MTEESIGTSTEMTQPVIIDLGRQKRRALKNLKRGEGKLWNDVLDVVEEVKDLLGTDAEGKVLVPVVLIYRERARRQRINLDRLLPQVLVEDDEDEDDDYDDDDDD
ncbi:MAG TPA: hypothetical protein VJM08_16640 [Anaerolineales bacterium]|nr:hypothetical protein [Anaerolineales bacterium]